LVVALIGMAGLTLFACGADDHVASAQTIDITMTDNAFVPTRVSAPRGETVTLRFTNDGAVRHEAVLGDETQQAEHHEEMSASTAMSDDMDGEHGNSEHGSGSDGSDSVTVEPGQTGSITASFDESGSVLIGCHEPGHWEDGMKAAVDVR
jgi:uncharacterized cupredoxin-like copper-binding protein